MTELFASGRIVDPIILGMLLEGAGLIWWHRRTGRGWPARVVAPTITAGILLLLALRLALVGAAWPWIALCIGLGGLAHVADLWMRRAPADGA